MKAIVLGNVYLLKYSTVVRGVRPILYYTCHPPVAICRYKYCQSYISQLAVRFYILVAVKPINVDKIALTTKLALVKFSKLIL